VQKTIIAVLILLVLLLSAALVRVQGREQQLEERLAAAERVRNPRPTTEASPARSEESPASAAPEAYSMTSMPPALQDRHTLEEKINPPPQPKPFSRSPRVLTPSLNRGVGTVLSLTPEEPALPLGRRPGYLGISGVDAEGGGVQVTQVQPGTVAGLSGLLPGDVLLEVNGQKVANYADLASKVRLFGEGGPVTLRIRRGLTEFYQGAQLGPRPP